MGSTIRVIVTLFMVALLLLSPCRAASRPGPTQSPDASQTNVPTTEVATATEGHTFDPMVDQLNPASFAASNSHKVVEGHDLNEEDLCEGLGEDDCLTRRTLAAHIDYIYTQRRSKP